MTGADDCKQRLLEWLRPAVEEGWCEPGDLESLAAVDTRSAEGLFEGHGARPLTVGLFGGTGVGKSSLLNRLVGETVARVGVERPTSTEVTLYAHEHYPMKDLSGLFPVERVSVLTHRRDIYRDVVWIDMPDMDSIEQSNRELVFEWLPRIDWLVYVVSPEKYRDDAGWRVLQQRGHRHHWMFIINHWDSGVPEQYEDFKGMLQDAGLGGYPVLKTSCGAPVADDDFDQVAATIERALREHGLEHLQRIGEQARLSELALTCARYGERLGDADAWRTLTERGAGTLDGILTVLNQRIREEAAIQAAGVPDRSSNRATTPPEPEIPGLVSDGVEDIETSLVLVCEELKLPAAPVRTATVGVLATLERRFADAVRDGFRSGITRPGNALQRLAGAWMRKLVYALPLAAAAAIGYVVLSRYRQGLSGAGEFLGFDFLAHSIMVLGLAALLPYLLGRLLRPSVRRSMEKRVDQRLRRTQADVVGEWREALAGLQQRARELGQSLDAIRRDINRRL